MANTYTVDDLTSGRLGKLDPPARLAVIGDPVAHSKSPAFQNAALRASEIDAQYVAIHVTPDELPTALRALPDHGFIGTNVTVPHKTATRALVDELDPSVALAGGVNTVVVRDDSTLQGFTTDGPGFARAIREEFSVDLRDLRILILGAGGGAGRAIAAQCANAHCERLVLVNRTEQKVRQLAAELAPYFRSDRLEGPVERLEAIPHDPTTIARHLDYVDLIVNATTLGMKRSDPPLLPSSLITPNLMVYDTVYATGQSRLIEDALDNGARAASGLTMLLHQGALSFETWFNRDAPLAAMRQALK
ncbi:MAG: shikimate dehydrogenase [Chthoniobacterales bacterium]